MIETGDKSVYNFVIALKLCEVYKLSLESFNDFQGL